MNSHARKLAREDFITEALRTINDAIGEEEPHAQAFRIIAAVKAMRDDKARVAGGGVDYLEKVQRAARSAWHNRTEEDRPGIGCVATPIGNLMATTWRVEWSGGREAWRTEYALNGDPITIREIKAAGLAQRPTTRNRQKKDGRK